METKTISGSSAGQKPVTGTYAITDDFMGMTFDKHFKNVFGIKRILAVVIKETIDLYASCTIEEVVSLIEYTTFDKVCISDGLEKVSSVESHAIGEGSVYFDILVKVGLPKPILEKNKVFSYFCIKLDAEMQRKLNPGYILSKRGLYYCSRMITEQLPVINTNTNYDVLVPVYSIWITLVDNSSGLAGKIIRYQIKNTSNTGCEDSNKSTALERLDSVSGMMNLYFICIDKDVVNNKEAIINSDGIMEYLSLLFAGKFQDERLKKHDSAFDGIMRRYGKELNDMANYMSEIEEERAEARAEGREEGREEGRAEGRAEERKNIKDTVIKLLKMERCSASEITEFFPQLKDEDIAEIKQRLIQRV